jgi:hypothetical protein
VVSGIIFSSSAERGSKVAEILDEFGNIIGNTQPAISPIANPSDCVSWFRNPFSSGLTQDEKNCLILQGQADIQTVPDNVAKYYPDQTTLQHITQQVADQQKAQVPGDVAAITKGQCDGLDLSGIGLDCYNSFSDFLSAMNTAVKVGLAVVVLILAGYFYVFAVKPAMKAVKA